MRVLHVLSDLGGGGVASLLLNYYRKICNECVFDFVVTSEQKGLREDEFSALGSSIWHVPRIHKSLFLHLRLLKRIILTGEYDVVHVHGDYKGVFALLFAKKIKVSKRIAHSHRTLFYSPMDYLQSRLFIPVTKQLATHLVACGKDAAVSIWKEKNVYIVHNAIDVNNYKYNPITRKRIRDDLCINECYVIGHVGRFSFQKNHLFLLDVFEQVKKVKKNAVLLLIGDGEEKNRIIKKINDKNLSQSVYLLGEKDNVGEFLNAFDVFVLPSVSEGLPVTLVEAQTNGLPCVVASSITKEIKMSDNVHYVDLHNSLSAWADKIINAGARYEIDMDQSSYNIELESQKLLEYYKN